MRVTTFFLLFGMSSYAVGASEIAETPSSFIKEYDVLERRKRADVEDHISTSIRNSELQRNAAQLGKAPGQANRNVDQINSMEINSLEKNAHSYCYNRSDSSASCGATFTW